MTIIHKTSYPHTLESSPAPRNWEGTDWAEVPPELEDAVWACLGYCDITLGDLTYVVGYDEYGQPVTETVPEGVVTAITAHELPQPPEPEDPNSAVWDEIARAIDKGVLARDQ